MKTDDNCSFELNEIMCEFMYISGLDILRMTM
jgi:hypothetical protein